MPEPLIDTRFVALSAVGIALDRPLVVVDLGYSECGSSTGIAWTGRGKASNHRFGVALTQVGQALVKFAAQRPILVLEGPLLCRHTKQGNPMARGEFERGRAWYCQPAATTALAAQRILRELAHRLPPEVPPIEVAEAFLSNKLEKSDHRADAEVILRDFWRVPPVVLSAELEGLSPFLTGIAPIRVFAHGASV